MQEIVSVSNITKTFRLSKKQQALEKTRERVRTAVDGLSFSAYRGEIFGLLGPNGAGKTTTLRILATLIRPDSGDAVVDGESVVQAPEAVRARIGFLTSELKLEEYFTPRYLFDFFASLHGLSEETTEGRRRALFSRFGIDAFSEVKVANLSTGMKQKLSLVISIVHDPDVIIFDEPTNGLDVLTAKVVTDFLSELRREGKTVILSTHIFSLAERLCDRIGVIIDGRMHALGTLDEVRGGKSLEDAFFELYRSVKEGEDE
jgi:sodium transport system ATP-binding protein